MGDTDEGEILMGGAMLSKSLIQFSVDMQGCVPSLLFDLRPNYSEGNEVHFSSVQSLSRVRLLATP